MTDRTDLHQQHDGPIPRRARLAAKCGSESQFEIDQAKGDVAFWQQAIQVNLGVLMAGGTVTDRDRMNAIEQHTQACARLARLKWARIWDNDEGSIALCAIEPEHLRGDWVEISPRELEHKVEFEAEWTRKTNLLDSDPGDDPLGDHHGRNK